MAWNSVVEARGSALLKVRQTWVSAQSKITPASFSFLAGIELANYAASGRVKEITVLPEKTLRLKTARVVQRLDDDRKNSFPCLPKSKRGLLGYNLGVGKRSVSHR